MVAASEIPFDDLKNAITQGTIMLIDTRPADAVKTKGEIPGSHNIPLAEIGDAFKMAADAFKAKYKFDKTFQQLCFMGDDGKAVSEAVEKVKDHLGASQVLKMYSAGFADWQKKAVAGTASAKKLWGKIKK